MKISYKKRLVLTSLLSIASVAVITPILTFTSCNHSDSSTGGGTGSGGDKPTPPVTTVGDLNKDLPPNWTAANLENGVSEYQKSIQTKTVNELMTNLNGFVKQLNDVYASAYNGFDKVVKYDHTNEASWSLNTGETFQNVHDFFANNTSKNMYPAIDKFTIPTKDATPQEISEAIERMIAAYPYVATQFVYAKMAIIVDQLKAKNALNDQNNLNQIGTTLLEMYEDSDLIFNVIQPVKQNPWYSQYITGMLQNFRTTYENMQYEINNQKVDELVKNYTQTGRFIDLTTGHIPFTIYTTDSSKITPKTK